MPAIRAEVEIPFSEVDRLIEFRGRANGDEFRLTKVHFTPANAANMALLINDPANYPLVVIKKKVV